MKCFILDQEFYGQINIYSLEVSVCQQHLIVWSIKYMFIAQSLWSTATKTSLITLECTLFGPQQ